MDLSRFKVDLNKEEDGVWVDIGPDCRLCVARINNPKYKEVFRRLTRPYRRQIDNGTLPDEIGDKIMADAIADGCIRGWEGVEMAGEAIPYSPQSARDLMRNPQLKDFRDLVTRIANDADLYRQSEIEESEGN